MSEQPNGTWLTKPSTMIAVISAVVGIGIWVGATDYRGENTRQQLERHSDREAHDKASSRIATLEANYKNLERQINREMTEVKGLLRDLDQKIDGLGQ